MKTEELLRDAHRNVDGFLTMREGMFLYNTAKKCRKPIVEIGSWKGRSTVFLARGSLDGNSAEVYAIDPHIGSQEAKDMYRKTNLSTFTTFKNNIKKYGVSKVVRPIVAPSEKAAENWNRKIDFLWIDGDHSYAAALTDFEKWEPFVPEGCLVAFHDRFHAGPKKVIDEKFLKSKTFRDVHFHESIAYATKVRKNSFGDRIKGRYMLTVNNVYIFFYNNVPLPNFLKKAGKRILAMPYVDHSQ